MTVEFVIEEDVVERPGRGGPSEARLALADLNAALGAAAARQAGAQRPE